MKWETVIGLEIHVQLDTRSKMFCGCQSSFGARPNSQVCPVCLGLPGALPVTNELAIAYAVRAALALGCTVHEESVFARKNYFYPDLPKGYQISQFDRPLATRGVVRFESPDRGEIGVSITRLHVEEDAGKSMHDRYPGLTAVDLNRSGAPLAEIVTGPDLRTPAEARAFLVKLRQTLVYTGVSPCNMEEGTLRVDANLSIRRPGEKKLGTKTEVKNMNSFANVERALTAETERQISLRDSGGVVEQVTLLFDAASGTVHPMRSKEESHDYRYFPEPDIPPLVLDAAWIAEQQAALPELPDSKRRRFTTRYGLTEYHAQELTQERPVADYYEAVVRAGADPKAAAGWVMGDVQSIRKGGGGLPVPPERLAVLIALVEKGVVSQQAAKRVFPELVDGEDPEAVAERLGLLQVGDRDSLAAWVDEVIAAHPAEVGRYRGGEVKLMGFFVGQVMQRSGGKADPKGVQPVLKERLGDVR